MMIRLLLTALALSPSLAWWDFGETERKESPAVHDNAEVISDLSGSASPQVVLTKEVMFNPESVLGISHVSGFVTYVIPQSQAAKRGVESGWRITKIDGIPTDAMDLTEAFKKAKEGNKPFFVTFEEAKQKLEDYNKETKKAPKKKTYKQDAGWEWTPKQVGPSPPPARITVSAKPRSVTYTITDALRDTTSELTKTLAKLQEIMAACGGSSAKQCPADAPKQAATVLHELSETAAEAYQEARTFQLKEIDSQFDSKSEFVFEDLEETEEFVDDSAVEHERRRVQWMEDATSYAFGQAEYCEFMEMEHSMWGPRSDVITWNRLPISYAFSYPYECAEQCCSNQNCWGFAWKQGIGYTCQLFMEDFRDKALKDEGAMYYIRDVTPPGEIAKRSWKAPEGCGCVAVSSFRSPTDFAAHCQLSPFDEDLPIGIAKPVCYVNWNSQTRKNCPGAKRVQEVPNQYARVNCVKDFKEYSSCEDIAVSLRGTDIAMVEIDGVETKMQEGGKNLHVIAIDAEDNGTQYTKSANSWVHGEVLQVVDFIDQFAPGVTIALAVNLDSAPSGYHFTTDGSETLDGKVRNMLRSIGGTGHSPKMNDLYYSIVGFKGMAPGTAAESIKKSGTKGKVFCKEGTDDCGVPDFLGMQKVSDCTLPTLDGENCGNFYTNTTMAGQEYYVPCKTPDHDYVDCVPDFHCSHDVSAAPGPSPDPSDGQLSMDDIFFLACWELDEDVNDASKCPAKDSENSDALNANGVAPDCLTWAEQGHCSEDSEFYTYAMRNCERSCCLHAIAKFESSTISMTSFEMDHGEGPVDCGRTCAIMAPEANYFFIGPAKYNEPSQCFCSFTYDFKDPYFGLINYPVVKRRMVVDEDEFGYWHYSPVDDVKCQNRDGMGNTGATKGPVHYFNIPGKAEPLSAEFFVSTGQGSCSPRQDAHLDAEYFCKKFYGSTCIPTSYRAGKYSDAPRGLNWQMTMGDKCSSAGLDIPLTNCGRSACRIMEANYMDYDGLYDLVCECDGGASENYVNIWQLEQDVLCTSHEDCPTDFYCDLTQTCYDQSICHRAKDAIDGSCPATDNPTMVPTTAPTSMPTVAPTSQPTLSPTIEATMLRIIVTDQIEYSFLVLIGITDDIQAGMDELTEVKGYKNLEFTVTSYALDSDLANRYSVNVETNRIIDRDLWLSVAEHFTDVTVNAFENSQVDSTAEFSPPEMKESFDSEWAIITAEPTASPTDYDEFSCVNDFMQDESIQYKNRGVVARATRSELTEAYGGVSQVLCFLWCQFNTDDNFDFFELRSDQGNNQKICWCYDEDLSVPATEDGISYCTVTRDPPVLPNPCFQIEEKRECNKHDSDLCEWKKGTCVQIDGCNTFTEDMQDLYCTFFTERKACQKEGCSWDGFICENALKEKRIKCDGSELNACCNLPGCEVGEDGKCGGEFTGWYVEE